MKAAIGVYEDHDNAYNAVKKLKDEGFPVKQISIIGFAGTEVIDNEMHISKHGELTYQGVVTGITLGAAAGILTGIGLIVIPGFGALYGAGALIGAMAGADIGLLGGGITTLLINYGLHEKIAEKYEKELVEGKFLVIASGSHNEIDFALAVLSKHDTHTSLETYRKNTAPATKDIYSLPVQ